MNFYLIPCIFLIKIGLINNMTIPAAIGNNVNIMKNVDNPYFSEMESIKLPDNPARRFAMKLATNQIPNIRPISFTGANLLT